MLRYLHEERGVSVEEIARLFKRPIAEVQELVEGRGHRISTAENAQTTPHLPFNCHGKTIERNTHAS